jgi:hypothetical protein
VSGARPILKFFLDESVPDSVGKMFETHSHEVIYLNREIARGSSDYLVCMFAQINDATRRDV